MNTLSKFLYFADVLPNFAATIGIFCKIFIVVVCVSNMLFMAINEKWGLAWEKAPYHIFYAFLALLLIAFVPDRETIYLIAGSEIAEMAVVSDYGQEILNDIHTVIKQQIVGVVE